MLGQLLGKIHGTVAAAGAADADRDIAAAFGFEARQPGVEELRQIVAERDDVGFRFEPFAHGRVLARQRTQARFPVRIRQAARVEHEIGVGRHAATVRERFQEQRQAAGGEAHLGDDQPAQLMHVDFAGVDHAVGDRQHRAQQSAFGRDRLGEAETFAPTADGGGAFPNSA